MERFDLVSKRVAAGRVEYSANAHHPAVDLLRRLAEHRPTRLGPQDAQSARTRGRLRTLGAPLTVPPVSVSDDEREQALVDGVQLAHRDATLTRVFPIVLWRQWKHVDRNRLKETARRARVKHSLGFLAALTGQLSGDRALQQWANGLRDYRVTALRPFFELASIADSREITERNTPSVAREWGFLMNLDYESFEAAFQKFLKIAL
jgi:hypothetical protein